jgi:hypothetical protein
MRAMGDASGLSLTLVLGAKILGTNRFSGPGQMLDSLVVKHKLQLILASKIEALSFTFFLSKTQTLSLEPINSFPQKRGGAVIKLGDNPHVAMRISIKFEDAI